jgi:hypothetical protein
LAIYYFQELPRSAVSVAKPVPHVDPVIVVADMVTQTIFFNFCYKKT